MVAGAARYRLPRGVSHFAGFRRSAGLTFIRHQFRQNMFRRAASVLMSIALLKGAKPGRPSGAGATGEIRTQLVNLKTAHDARPRVPSTLLARADEVIE